jgi:hypothetical protein
MMRSDIRNMLRVCRFLAWVGLDLNFDQARLLLRCAPLACTARLPALAPALTAARAPQVSIMEEYQEQVPLEFDFCREAAMLTRIGGALASGAPSMRCACPAAVPALSARRVLTLEFMAGVPFSSLQKSLDAAPARAATTPTAPAALPPGAAPAEMAAMLRSLLEAFGHQIFIQGVFHSDPHPGNLLRLPDGRVGLLDFGECKELPDATRILFARLTIALAQRNPAAALPLLAACGLDIDGATPEFAMVAAYIMFDTRMDIKEAHMSPLDADADEMRAVKVRTLPAELFMLLRVVTLVRGMLALFKADVSAAQVWEPYARAALQKAGVEPPPPPPPRAAGAAAETEGTEAGGMYDRMYRLAEWMAKHELPHDRRALTPCAMNGLTTLAELAAADDARLERGLKKFTAEQRARCRALARDAVAAAAAAAPPPPKLAAAPAGAAEAPAKPAKTPAAARFKGSLSKIASFRAIAAK